MKLTSEDLFKYSYCPKLYEQAKKLSLTSSDQTTISPMIRYIDPFAEALSKFVLFFFRKELEDHKKLSLDYAFKVWSRLYKPKDSRKYNRSLIAIKSFYDWYRSISYEVLSVNHNISSFLYSYTLAGVIPVVFYDSKKKEAHLLFLSISPTVNLDAFYLPIFLQEELDNIKVASSIILSYGGDFKIYPTVREFDTRFFQSSLQDFIGVAESINEGLTYPNYAGCGLCPIRVICKARNGDE